MQRSQMIARHHLTSTCPPHNLSATVYAQHIPLGLSHSQTMNGSSHTTPNEPNYPPGTATNEWTFYTRLPSRLGNFNASRKHPGPGDGKQIVSTCQSWIFLPASQTQARQRRHARSSLVTMAKSSCRTRPNLCSEPSRQIHRKQFLQFLEEGEDRINLGTPCVYLDLVGTAEVGNLSLQ